MNLEESKLEGFDKKFAEETIKTLQELIKIDTTNPPGNEIAAANWIHDYLMNEGIEFVYMGKVLMLEKDWVKKTLNGEGEKIRTSLKSEEEREQLAIPDKMKEYSKRFFVIE